MIGRFISADSIIQDYFDPQALNRYSYARNNPLKYVDPDGHAYDIVDIGFFLHSAYTMIRQPSWANAGWLAADAVSLLPLIPSTGYARVGVKAAGKVTDIASNVNKAENAVDIAKSADRISDSTKS